MISEARSRCPRARLEVYTNGDFLSVDLARRLFASGLNSVLVSLYDGPHQIEHFTRLREEAGLTADQMILRERYKVEEGEKMHLSNRAGMIDFKQMGMHGRIPLDTVMLE